VPWGGNSPAARVLDFFNGNPPPAVSRRDDGVETFAAWELAGLAAGGRWIRTLGPPYGQHIFKTGLRAEPRGDRDRPSRVCQCHRDLAVLEIPDEFTERRSARATMGRGRRFLLALYVVADTIETLIEAAPAETSWLGIGLRAGMLVICPWVGSIKQRITEKLALTPPGY
jgi:hypothetical protein